MCQNQLDKLRKKTRENEVSKVDLNYIGKKFGKMMFACQTHQKQVFKFIQKNLFRFTLHVEI